LLIINYRRDKMEAKDKRILIYAISLVLVIAVIINGSRITKIDIPGLFGIEFSSENNQSDQQPEPSITSHTQMSEHLNNQSADHTESDISHGNPPLTTQTTDPGAVHQFNHTNPSSDQLDQSDITTAPSTIRYNLSGSWIGSDGSDYILEQTGNIISFLEYGLWGITASGSGTLSGNELVIDYETTFGTIGTAVLNLTDNGRQLSGIANDLTTGASTTLTLYKE